MKYIAYGSNMSLEQMKHRCPTARLIGTGYLPKHRLEFYLHATVEPDPRMRKGVPVAVFEISDSDEAALDFYEGYPNYYRKESCTVNMRDGSQIEGMIYIMNLHRVSPPAVRYYNGIADAYIDLGFGSDIRKHLVRALRRSQQRES
jgi:gamma-glutamylcyclotransferase (GGCT)/AIG2-like uncharacterized protein YtfP